MNRFFSCIGIIGHPRRPAILSTYNMLYRWLLAKDYQVIIETHIASQLNLRYRVQTGTLSDIGRIADLAVVVGGDGSMLSAARSLACYDIKVIGINRGNLGFLTDLDPENARLQLEQVLDGHFFVDRRFLLEAQICHKSGPPCIATAMNEIVVHSRKTAHMIEFKVYIDEMFAFSERSDGLIVSTPTGSTAYALSAGGPIVMPSVDAIALVPMFSHTLSARSLVIHNNSSICLRFSDICGDLEISFDSQTVFPIKKNDHIVIYRSNNELNLIHPKHYNYFNILSSKLGWSKKFF
ncbi:NAD(+) kinase [Candidatus Erwinia haradaeae]|uniref:NAD kinase n=1 Tax=Candidatus Erwinia haradaeae TaxID=1922217 RepID=A0A451D8H5_9GAMM|nr:NAD(+) kinase [Candidatus Erwinia haradaeae]VFP82117.1 NAD kinase [Candidatus Erwinia haradaeae]